MKKTIIKITIWAAICAISVFSILPNLMPDYWYIDLLSHFKFQYVILSLILIIPILIFLNKKWMALVVLISCIIWNLFFIIPYYIKTENLTVDTNKKLKISSINLLSSNSNFQQVKDYIASENPDVLVLIELNAKWLKALDEILPGYKFKQLIPRSDNFGIGLLSKIKMNAFIDYFETKDKPSVIGTLQVNNDSLSIIATHPAPPVDRFKFKNRNAQLKNIINHRSKLGENVVIIGDLNTSSFSNHFTKLLSGEFKDSRKGFGLLQSWPANIGVIRTTLDHCLVSQNIKVINRTVGENIGSDHLPINVTISTK